MTFLRNATINKKQTGTIYNFQQTVTLHTAGLSDRAVDINSFAISNSTYYSERPCLYTSVNYKGSITIEAAIGFPIFFFVILSLIYIINIMYVQTSLQIALEETVRNASKAAYITSQFYSLTSEEQSDAVAKEPSLAEQLGTSALSIAYIHNAFLTDENKKLLDNSPVENGSDGISFLSSSLDLSSGIADIILSYTVSIPFIPDNIFSFKLSNRCYMRLYTGRDMDKEQTATDVYVYYTTTGRVYHFNRYCQYLLNYTEAVRFLDMDYQLVPCALCDTITLDRLKSDNPVVYTTESKYCYHTTLKCQSFTDMVFRRHYSSLEEDDDICELCLKGY